MQMIPIKTRVLEPPQDDLHTVLDESLPTLCETDVVLISSKVVAIHQGRCLPVSGIDKAALVAEEAEVVIKTQYRPFPLTIKYNTFLSAAGIDESNAAGQYILLPKDPFQAASDLHAYILKQTGLKRLGLIITDSHSQPFRYGATGVALSWWGIEPLKSHIGKHDLFGREIKYERSNIVDGLAAGATVVMGEVAECQPIVIARGVPDLIFTEESAPNDLFAPPEDDTFRVLYERFLKK